MESNGESVSMPTHHGYRSAGNMNNMLSQALSNRLFPLCPITLWLCLFGKYLMYSIRGKTFSLEYRPLFWKWQLSESTISCTTHSLQFGPGKYPRRCRSNPSPPSSWLCACELNRKRQTLLPSFPIIPWPELSKQSAQTDRVKYACMY